MRGLIIFCIISWAVAMPQGLYHQNQANQREEEKLQHGDVLQELPDILQKQQFSGNLASLTSLEHHHFGLSSPESHVPLPFTSYGVVPPPTHAHSHNEVIVSKQFFLHSAPEEEEEEIPEKILSLGQPRKNFNVVFIRTPVKQHRPTSIKIIPAVKEDKTIVYVLTKKTDAADIKAHVEEVPNTTTKPEVYFIKYRTPEEATHAQEKIQAEYESLGGSTKVSHEAVSQVSSVIGSLDARTMDTHLTKEEYPDLPESNGYLPPNLNY